MPLSIIIPAHNQAPELQRHLPAIMEQDYDDFEVIVVDMSSTDETMKVLEDMELQYPSLRHTCTPSTARDISLERLALTLGFRSAKHEWMVVTHADCRPATSQWLRCMAEAVAEEKEILVGVAKYDEQRHTWFDYKVGFYRLWNTLANLRHIRGGHAAVRADGCNVGLRRSFILSQDGFGDHLNLLTGAEELLVNRLSTAKNTVVCDSTDAIVIEDCLPARRLWKKHRAFYMETRRHQRHNFLYRTRNALRLLLPWLLLATLCALWPLLHHFLPEEDVTVGIITALAVVLTLVIVGIWINRWNRTAHALGYQRSYFLTLPLFTLALPFWNLSAWISHHLSPKSEFRKKFV